MAMRQRRRFSNRFNRNARTTRSRRGTRRRNAFKATMQRASINPQPNILQPWNSVVVARTVSITNSTSFTVTLGYLYSALIEQLGLIDGSSLGMRIMRITAYDLAGRPLSLWLYDYASPTDDNLASTYDIPGRSTWARASLTYPKSVSASAIASNSGESATLIAGGDVGIPYGTATVTTTAVMFKIHVLWRPLIASVPSITNTMRKITLNGSVQDADQLGNLRSEPRE